MLQLVAMLVQDYDLGKSEWRLGGELLKDGPLTSFDAILAGVHVGFNFK